MKPIPEILVYSPSVSGGLAEYTYCQAEALTSCGADITCLVAPSFLGGRATAFKKEICLREPNIQTTSAVLRKLQMAWNLILSQYVLAIQIWRRRPALVLLDSYVEYLSPVWIWPHWFLRKVFRVRYAANLHDPVRNYQVGPAWWHKLSVRLAYCPLDFVLVHDKLAEPSPVPNGIGVVQVPHGLYSIRGEQPKRDAIRAEWGIKATQTVFLSFGFVRDGKNLDHAIRALAQVPQACLVVAGSVASNKDKSFAFYQALARELGVFERCRFFEGFVADEELGKFFSASDVVLLTYSASFHSQSGVLNIAARAEKPVLASASPCALIDSVRRFNLGFVVSPDSVEALVEGMHRISIACSNWGWRDYGATVTWAENARRLLAAAGFENSQPSEGK